MANLVVKSHLGAFEAEKAGSVINYLFYACAVLIGIMVANYFGIFEKLAGKEDAE